MKITREIIQATYNITELNQEDLDTLKLALTRGLDYYWQYGQYHRVAINDTPYKSEMDKIQALLVKISKE